MRLAVTENIIFRKMISGWPQISPLTRKWISPLIFTSIHFRKERERERERARARGEDPVRDRELQLQSDGAIDGEIAIAIWRHRDLGLRRRSRSRSRSRSRRDRDLVMWSLMIFFPGCGFCFVFSDLCFPSSFPNTRKYFPENFLKCNQTQKYFPFPEISISGKYVFSEKRFTATKHSLNPNPLHQPNQSCLKIRFGSWWRYPSVKMSNI